MGKSQISSDNLFIVSTPLQALIAYKIGDGKVYDVVFLTTSENKKNHYYFNKLAKNANNAFYFFDNTQSKFSSIKSALSLRCLLLHNSFSYNNIYLASIHELSVQFFLSKLEFKKIYTFDDGLGNLNYDGLYYRPQQKDKRFLLWKILGNIYDLEKIKFLSAKHFSIYKNKPNIIKNVEFVNLFENSKDYDIPVNRNIAIFLGQPLYEVNKRYNESYIEKIVSGLSINYYFSHPRENYHLVKVKKIETNLIFEEYLKEFLFENPSTQIKLYSFFSTVLVNINHRRVKKIALYDDFLINNYSNIYTLLSQSDCELLSIGVNNEKN